MRPGVPSSEYVSPRPYRLLAVIGVLGALQCLAVLLAPPAPDTNRAVYLAVGAVSLLISVVLVAFGPRIGPALLTVVVPLTTVMVCGLVAAATTGEGQLLIGFSLTLLGIYSAYFLSWAMVLVQCGVAFVCYPVALLANPLLAVPWYGAVVMVVNLGVTILVARLVARLRTLAVHDPLTGAHNRQGLVADADLAHRRDVRAHVPTTVVEIDLDGFKAYNDRYGHETGDHLLAGLTEDWRGILRRTDILARTGGDEFVIVLPGTSEREAEVLIQRMRGANPAPWTYGLAEWQASERLPDALRHADLEMYLHKPERRGRAAS